MKIFWLLKILSNIRIIRFLEDLDITSVDINLWSLLWSITDLERWGSTHNKFIEHMDTSKSGSFKWKCLLHRWRHSSNNPGSSQKQAIVSFWAATSTQNLCRGFGQLVKLVRMYKQFSILFFFLPNRIFEKFFWEEWN